MTDLDALLERLDDADETDHSLHYRCHGAAAAIRELRGLSEERAHYLRENAALRALLRVAKCPNAGCDGKGSIAHPVGDGEWEQEQCQWCDERDAIDAARGGKT